MRCAAAALVLLLIASNVTAQPAEPGTYSFRAAAGFANQSLGDVNDDIAQDAAAYRPLSTSLQWDEYGNAVPWGIEFGYQYSERWSWAFGFTWQKSTVDHGVQLDFLENGITYTGELTEDEELRLLDLYATAIWWIPRASGLHVGGQLGFAFGKLDLSNTVFLTGNDGSFADVDGTIEGHASGFSAGLYAGYEVALTPMWAISARGGYLYCNLGEMDGRIRLLGTTNAGPINAAGTGPLTDNNGEPIDWDWSGVRVSGAISYRFRWSGQF